MTRGAQLAQTVDPAGGQGVRCYVRCTMALVTEVQVGWPAPPARSCLITSSA